MLFRSDLVTGLRPATCGTKGKSARRLVSVGAARSAKALSEGWRLRLRPNSYVVKPCRLTLVVFEGLIDPMQKKGITTRG